MRPAILCRPQCHPVKFEGFLKGLSSFAAHKYMSAWFQPLLCRGVFEGVLSGAALVIMAASSVLEAICASWFFSIQEQGAGCLGM